MNEPTPSSATRLGGELVAISAVILFLELACIRWFSAHVMFLTFFTNTILLACFVGMSVGCLIASQRRHYIRATPLWLALTVAAGLGAEKLSSRLEKYVDVGNQQSPQMVYFGTEYHAADFKELQIPIEAIAGLFFALIAITFIGPGQEMGRAFTRVTDRVKAYTLNIFGSVLGIVGFAVCSFYQTSPVVWFALITPGVLYFVFRPSDPHDATWGETAKGNAPRGLAVIAMLGVVVMTTYTTDAFINRHGYAGVHYWSPYYRVDFIPEQQEITTNLISHQQMRSTQDKYPAYALPYLLTRSPLELADRTYAGMPMEKILLIGAGTGNDLSRALQWGTPRTRIDAVEIDPVIQRIGALHHPDRPYSDPRVTLHLDDGRNFLRRAAQTAAEQYDLVIYALVDSLVLQSGYSNIRLESYLFTEQAFADVQKCLKPKSGLFVMYNFFRQGWIVTRIHASLTRVFGTEPLVLTLPPKQQVHSNENFDGFTVFFAGSPEALSELKTKFAYCAAYVLPRETHLPLRDETQAVRGFHELLPLGQERDGSILPLQPRQVVYEVAGVPMEEWMKFYPAKVEESPQIEPATDDWPFLYLRQRMIPDLSLRGMAVMAGVALLLLIVYQRKERPSHPEFASRAERCRGIGWRMFFLGAGFMLIETKAVVHMALLFGSTWMVNTIVFFAVLVMILLANLLVVVLRPRTLYLPYLGLLASLALNVVIPLDTFLGLERTTQVIASCILVFAPIAFASIIFAVSFARTTNPDRAFGANIAGALLGGLAENGSMWLGFGQLLLVAVGFYLLSTLGGNRPGPENDFSS